MKQQKGFTLIELIIVIVILGILAVTAAPRFIDLQSDARTETMQGVKAAIQGASQLVYAKAAIAGDQKGDGKTVSIGSDSVTVNHGYPAAASLTSIADFQDFVDIDDEKLEVETVSGSPVTTVRVKYINIDTVSSGGTTTGCFVEYVEPEDDGDVPSITVESTLC